YFRVGSNDLTEMCAVINEPNLRDAKSAVREIQGGDITEYSQIHERYPHAPADNELNLARVMDVNDANDWNVIQSWKDNDDLDWFYNILLYLKTGILHGSRTVARSAGRPRPSMRRLSSVPTQDEHRV